MWQLVSAHCGAALSSHGPLLAALFFAGLVGGATHCVGMCGPFVLTQVGARARDGGLSEWRRLGGAALIPYHLGRTTTYAGLGAVAASITGGIAAASGLRWIAATLLLATATAFVLIAMRDALPMPALATDRIGAAISRAAAPLFRAPTGLNGYGLGLALGFLPCGLVYAALAAAASTGDPLAATFAMAAFAAGTAPSLILAGWLGDLAARRYRALARCAMTPLMLVNAAVLFWLAWRLIGA